MLGIKAERRIPDHIIISTLHSGGPRYEKTCQAHRIRTEATPLQAGGPTLRSSCHVVTTSPGHGGHSSLLVTGEAEAGGSRV